MQSVYKLPSAPGNMGRLQWRAVGLGLLVLFMANVAATQSVAHGFDYQSALGMPLTTQAGVGLYPPYMWIIWFLRFGQDGAPEVRHVVGRGLAIAASGSALSVLAGALMMFLSTRRSQNDGVHLHGSAHWARRVDIEAMGLIAKRPVWWKRTEVAPAAGVYVGAWQEKQTAPILYLRHNGPENILAFAPTRSGKGVGLVLPTLLSWPHSAVVYDIKGENYALTAGWRAGDGGNRVVKFSPVEIGIGAQFNPLAEIRLGTPRDVSDAQNIAQMLTHPNGDSDDEDHWVESATSLLTGVILYACYAALNEGRTACLPDVAHVLTRPGETFVDTLNEMLLQSQDPAGRFGWTSATGRPTAIHPVVAEKAQEMLNKEEREQSGILSSAKVKLQLYSDPIVASNIRCSDFSVDDLVNQETPVTLYIVVPPSDKDRAKPLTRLLFALIVNRLTESMQFAHGRSVQTNRHRLLMMIDEFPTLGRMDGIVNAMGYTAGYGIKFYLIVQDKTQLNRVYGENELVFSATHVRVAYAPNDPETAELLSRMTGTTTVLKAATSYSGKRLSPMLDQVASNIEAVERPLLTPDECGRLPGPQKDRQGNITQAGDMLIFVTGFAPIYGRQILYFDDPVFEARARLPAPSSPAIAFVGIRPGSTMPVTGGPIAPVMHRSLDDTTMAPREQVVRRAPTGEDVENDVTDEVQRLRQADLGSSESALLGCVEDEVDAQQRAELELGLRAVLKQQRRPPGDRHV